jgi:hypothetical protein
MPGREIEFIFPKRKVRIAANLLNDLAPQTCAAVWSVLGTSGDPKSMQHWPGRGLVRNGRYSGPELFLMLPNAKKLPPIENQTFRPIPGDVMVIVLGGHNPNVAGTSNGGSWEIALFYDRNGDLEVKHAPGVEGRGWLASRFAKIPDAQLGTLLELGNSVWSEGTERIVVRRKT